MKKLLIIAALPLVSLLAGCTADVDSTDSDEDTGESQDAITSFFGSGDGSSPFCQSGTPIAKNPQYINGRVYVDAAGSCIMVGASMKLLVPFSVTTYGAWSMGFDDSGTRLRTPSVGASSMPAGTCRMVQITNPNGQVSNTPSFCR